MSLYQNIHAMRKQPETARVGLNYRREDDSKILEMASQGIPHPDIAKDQKRTTNAIRTRIAILVAHIMKQYDMSLDEASRTYHINKALLSKWYSIQCEKDATMRQWIRDSVGPVGPVGPSTKTNKTQGV